MLYFRGVHCSGQSTPRTSSITSFRWIRILWFANAFSGQQVHVVGYFGLSERHIAPAVIIIYKPIKSPEKISMLVDRFFCRPKIGRMRYRAFLLRLLWVAPRRALWGFLCVGFLSQTFANSQVIKSNTILRRLKY